ncbi:Fur family transcriptional regulator [uncultured Clostridium sp.]|uniref:Fur family transcriptional regulator n=1 Tax=uncultured Clostridium sp. TaxID=59620 RepID=UPI002639BDEC|nr:Fur family transcriptional regulator [uncultured Clostridium sp.]
MDINDILRNKGLKVTKARTEILEVFLTDVEKSLNAEEIFSKLRSKGKNINLSTVYRTLDSFLESLILDRFILENGVAVYKIHRETHKHILECNICHKEVEVPCPIKQIEEILKEQTGFTLTEHSLKMKGVCNKCKK